MGYLFGQSLVQIECLSYYSPFLKPYTRHYSIPKRGQPKCLYTPFITHDLWIKPNTSTTTQNIEKIKCPKKIPSSLLHFLLMLLRIVLGECKRTTCEKLWRRTCLQKRPSGTDEGGGPSCSIRWEQQPECPPKNIRCKHPVKEEDVIPARVLHICVSTTSPRHHQPCKLLHRSTGHLYLTIKRQ